MQCKEYGHNVKTFKGSLKAKEKKKKSTAITSSQPNKPRRSRPVTRAYSSQPVTRA